MMMLFPSLDLFYYLLLHVKTTKFLGGNHLMFMIMHSLTAKWFRVCHLVAGFSESPWILTPGSSTFLTAGLLHLHSYCKLNPFGFSSYSFLEDQRLALYSDMPRLPFQRHTFSFRKWKNSGAAANAYYSQVLQCCHQLICWQK
jgi:hypothetical protein